MTTPQCTKAVWSSERWKKFL